MKLSSLLAVVILAALLLASISPGELSAQNAATMRLMELINAGDIDSVEDKLPRAAIDAGPPAIPVLRNVLDRPTDEDRRLLALAAAVYIGGDAAISLVRREYDRRKDDEFKFSLATALASADTPANRRELIRMLADDDFATVSAAAFALGILRANDATPALRAVPQRPNRDESEAARLALTWIEKGYWAVGSSPDNERGRAIAAVLRNGSPNIKDTDHVFDEDSGGFWKYGSTGWVFAKGEPLDRTPAGPSITGLIGSEGCRALVSVDMRCGMLCGTGYTFVLRKEDRAWKVQMILLAWIA